MYKRQDVDGSTQGMSLDSITGPGFDTSLIPDGVMEILQSGGYKLSLANSSYKTGTDAKMCIRDRAALRWSSSRSLLYWK